MKTLPKNPVWKQAIKFECGVCVPAELFASLSLRNASQGLCDATLRMLTLEEIQFCFLWPPEDEHNSWADEERHTRFFVCVSYLII